MWITPKKKYNVLHVPVKLVHFQQYMLFLVNVHLDIIKE